MSADGTGYGPGCNATGQPAKPSKPNQGVPSAKQGSGCGPNSSDLCTNEQYGICGLGLGCSGSTDDLRDVISRVAGPLETIGNSSDLIEEISGVKLPKLFGLGLGIGVQLMKDANQPNLTNSQRVARALVVGGEELVVGLMAHNAGMEWGLLAFGATTAALPEATPWADGVAFFGGYAVGYVATSVTMSYYADWINNSYIFPAIQRSFK